MSANEVILFKTVVCSNGTFSSQNDIYDGSGHRLRTTQWGGTFVVTNRAVECTITRSSDKNAVLPRKVQPEPIIRLDDHEKVIINENGMRVVSTKVSP